MQLPRPGEVFEARYRIVDVLGEGGFATVFAADEVDIGRRVAVKILKPGAQGYDTALERRFQRELRVVATLKSPHTVKLLNHGRSASGLLFAVFEYLEGRELAAVLRERSALSADEIVHVLRQLLDSLGEAHRKGVIHRDLKPENVLVTRGGDPLHVKLIDFGIARALEDGGPTITGTGELIGTPRYMSPEQLTHRELTPASDLYTLGIMAFEMAVGRDALHGGSWSDQLDRLHSGHLFSIPTVERFGPVLPGVIARMSALRPEARFQSAAEVLAALDPRDRRPVVVDAASHPPWVIVALGVVVAVVVVLVVARAVTPVSQAPTPVARHRVTLPEPPLRAAVTPVEVSTEPDMGDGTRSAGCGLAPARPDFGEVYIPKGYSPATAYPLVLLAHDKGTTAAAFLAVSGFIPLAEKHGFLVGASGYEKADINGFRFEMTERYCVDQSRIFLVGHGAGAQAAHELVCGPYTAIASHSDMGGLRDCPNDRDAVPGIHLIATKSKRHARLDAQLEADENSWSHKRGCGDVAKKSKYFEHSGGECRSWACPSEFVTCRLNGGHPWPGTVSRDPELDGVPPDFPSAEVIWKFFSSLSESPQ